MSLIKKLIKSKDMIDAIAMGPGISKDDYLVMVEPIVKVIEKLRTDNSLQCTRQDFEMILDHNTTDPDEPSVFDKAKQFMDENLILYRYTDDNEVYDCIEVDWYEDTQSHHYTIPYDKVWTKTTKIL
jgi:hypothetical protein